MGILLCIIFFTALYRAKPSAFCKGGRLGGDYLSMETTTAVKGIFILCIFLTHSAQYVKVGADGLAPLYNLFRNGVLQGVVTMFFFYSGYGVLESFKKKGFSYIQKFPKNRILKIVLHFDIAVLAYLVLALIRGKSYTLSHTLLAFTGWTALGNSNWFVFDILAAYLLTYAAFVIFRKAKPIFSVIAVTVLSLGFMLVMYKTQPDRFYNTFICYAAGMWWSLYKEKLEKLLFTKKPVWALAFLISLGAYYALYRHRENAVCYCAMMLVFTFACVLFTAAVKVGNRALAWFGKVSFSIFIIMRIPMIILCDLGFAKDKYLFIFLSFIATAALAWGYDALLGVIDRKLFAKK